MRCRPIHRRGFTLVEVLASVTILAIVVPFVMRGATLATTSASLSRHRAEAATLGEAQLADLVTEDLWETQTQGTFPDFPQYTWTLQTQTRSEADVTELMLTVMWKERGQDRTLNVSTMVYAAANGGITSGSGTGGTGTGGAQ
jgi:prepilin-type N-terminal cleavage/methylation domain-containing protein